MEAEGMKSDYLLPWFLNTPGVTPIICLNWLLKYDIDENPTRNATSLTEMLLPGSERSFTASFILALFMNTE